MNGFLGVDAYTMRARILPASVAIIPAYLAFVAWAGPSLVNSAYGGVATLIAAGLLSQFVRDEGRKKEAQLFQIWDGPPTHTMLDVGGNLNPESRARYLRKLACLYPQSALIRGSEVPNVAAAIDWLQEKTRDQRRFPLVHEENINYGFRRNLWAIKPLGVATCLLAIAAVTIKLGIAKGNVVAGDVAVLAMLVPMLVAWVGRVKPEWVRLAAMAYSRRLLGAIDEL